MLHISTTTIKYALRTLGLTDCFIRLLPYGYRGQKRSDRYRFVGKLVAELFAELCCLKPTAGLRGRKTAKTRWHTRFY
jgi:hypothetical protein